MRTLLIAALAALSLAGAARAGEAMLGDLRLNDPYARATTSMAKAGAAYLEIHNHGATDRLLSARTEAAQSAELHESVMQDGVMRMRALEGGLAIGEGDTVALAPGGLHIMLMGLKAPLEEGASFPLTLVFERAGEVTVEVEVRSMAAGGHSHSHGDYLQQHDHGHGQKMK